jgi:hypothetical protein
MFGQARKDERPPQDNRFRQRAGRASIASIPMHTPSKQWPSVNRIMPRHRTAVCASPTRGPRWTRSNGRRVRPLGDLTKPLAALSGNSDSPRARDVGGRYTSCYRPDKARRDTTSCGTLVHDAGHTLLCDPLLRHSFESTRPLVDLRSSIT